MSPTVTVIIPTYNRALFIDQTIDSVLAQKFNDFEIIVVDDASTDNTAQILDSYKDERIQVITLDTNTGPSKARNVGLEAARGEYIAFLDSDDLWYSNMLTTTVSYLRKNLDVDLVCGLWDTIDETGQRIQGKGDFSELRKKIHADFLRTIAVGNFMLPTAMLIKRQCIDCAGNFNESLKGVVDWDLWIRIARCGHKADLINVLVASYRRHSSNITVNPQRMEYASRQVITKLFSDKQLEEHISDLEEHSYIYAWLSLAAFCHGAGLDVEVNRFVRMAEDLYPKAANNPELSINYLQRLFHFPNTEHFKQTIIASTPQAYPLYLWLLVKKSFQQKMFSGFLYYLLKLLGNHPSWLAKKLFVRARRDINRLVPITIS